MQSPARHWQRIEGGLVLLAVLGGLWIVGLSFPIWAAVLIFFAADLSMGFYCLGPKVGAMAYNLAHLYGWGALLVVLGLLSGQHGLAEAGALWVGHIGFDRMLGYGLKLPSEFRDTHLGRIGHG